MFFFLADKYGNVYGMGGKEYIYHHAEDESSFQLVDTSRLQRPMHQKSRTKYNQVCGCGQISAVWMYCAVDTGVLLLVYCCEIVTHSKRFVVIVKRERRGEWEASSKWPRESSGRCKSWWGISHNGGDGSSLSPLETTSNPRIITVQ